MGVVATLRNGVLSALVVLAVAFATTVGAPDSAGAQTHDDRRSSGAGTLGDDVRFGVVNAFVGGMTAGIIAHLRDRSFQKAFVGGVTGGSLAWVAKRVAASRFDGAGLAGRQIGAVGASIVRNASLDVGLLDSLTLPVGPFRLQVGATRPTRPRLDFDLQEGYRLVEGLLDSAYSLDWGRTWSAGTPVFTTDARLSDVDRRVNGLVTGGTIVLRRQEQERLDDVFAHERVHVLQTDFLKTTVGYPLERWARRAVGFPDVSVTNHMLTGLGHEPLVYLMTGPLPRALSPLEVEAEFLEVR